MPVPQSARADTACRHLFVYGSLVDPRCLDEVLGHAHPGERLAARLSGYQRITTATFPYPFLVADGDASVDGVLVMDLSRYDIQSLDQYEDVETGTYTRQLVEVDAWGCGPRPFRLQAFTYVAGPGLIASTSR